MVGLDFNGAKIIVVEGDVVESRAVNDGEGLGGGERMFDVDEAFGTRWSPGGFFRDLGFPNLKLPVELPHHTPGGHEEDDVSNAVNYARKFPERVVAVGEDVTDACK